MQRADCCGVRRAIFSFAVSVLVALLLQAPSAAGNDGNVETVRRWTFDSADDLRGWEPGQGIRSLRVEGGRLAGEIAAEDAYLFAPPSRAPLDGLAVRVRWSAPRPGSGQCYFATEESPAMGEDKVISREVPGGRVVETEFLLDPAGGAPGNLVRFRLDPFNNAYRGEPFPFEIDEVALVRLEPRLEVQFAPERSSAAAGERVPFHLRLRRLSGRRLKGAVEARIPRPDGGEERLRLEIDPRAAGDAGGAASLSFSGPGIHAVRARISIEGGMPHDIETTVAVGLNAGTPGGAESLLVGRDAALELLPAAEGGGAVAGARLWTRQGDGWLDAGLLLPLAELAFEDGGAVRRLRPRFAVAARDRRGARLEAEVPSAAGPWRVEVALRFETDRGPGAAAGKDALQARAVLRGPRGGRLLRFSAPALRRLASAGGALGRRGLFGGLEFLEPGERSSDAGATGPRFAERWTPHPYKVSLPVMAVDQEGALAALLWDPLEEWAPGRRLPSATFASPNAPAGQTDHLMEIWAPSVPEFADENASIARSPFILDGAPIEVAEAIDARAGRPLVEAARRWYEIFGIPAAPPAPHAGRALHDLIARSFGETLWWPEEKGWRGHWFLESASHYRADFAAELLLHSKYTGERRWTEATGLDPGRSVIETLGTLRDRARGGDRAAAAAARAMRADGTFPYRESAAVQEKTRELTGGRHDSLGEEGATTLGTCAQGALPLLRHLALSGDAEFLEPAERALRAMRRFASPRGAQVWEVHLQAPDIRAAALAVEAFRLGYLATGDEAYLEEAFRWANAGLPFLYSWKVPLDPDAAAVRTARERDGAAARGSLPAAQLYREPRRQVTPYGSIPVFGVTFYTVSWFGVLVQWCGLEWAWKTLELLDLRDDPILRAAAQGVIDSGLQQMFDREPWTGLYPDVWNLEGNWAGGALISPNLLVQALRAGGRLPAELRQWSRRLGSGRDALLIHGWGEAVSCSGNGSGLDLEARFLQNEPAEILIARSPRPAAVSLNGAEIPEAPSGKENGWRHDPERRLLEIRYTSPERAARIAVRYR